MSLTDVITLDGPAGSGKSTVAKTISETLHRRQIDSGAMYRTITYLAIQYASSTASKISNIVNDDKFFDYLEKNRPVIEFTDNQQQIRVHKEDMENYIRKPEITEQIKYIADNIKIRKTINSWIQELATNYPVIADGRDMGTVVFPDAKYKFFLEASPEIRAERRFNEFISKNPNITKDEVLKQIQNRDAQDMARKFGGLKAANNAIIIDTSNQEIKAVVQFIITSIRKIDSN
ncbi:MAG: (d)CMP kinase [Leptospirales bacterium]